MSNMLENGIAYLNRIRKQSMCSTVSYYRVSTESTLSVSATIGESLFVSNNLDDITIRTHVLDFIISYEELGFEPSKGDEITYGGYRYEVLAPNSEPCWRWSDMFHNMVRIHTKLIGDSED